MSTNEDSSEDLLSAYFEKSATAVRRSFSRFERDLARPTVRYLLAAFKHRPIRSTFLAIYAALSALPILSFIGLSVFIFSSFAFFALSIALLSAVAVVLFSGFWLGCALLFLFLLAIPLTAGALGTYLLLRFVFFARQEGSARQALTQWAQEAKVQFVKRSPEHPAPASQADTLVIGSVTLDGATFVDEKEAEQHRHNVSYLTGDTHVQAQAPDEKVLAYLQHMNTVDGQ
ncbi:hypothetical protein BC628DRAFT_1364586 [Trametes gibbosa]|nr:hypothetical protein BC628DRAFT_1389458 [Trametes gibbosa]KAI0828205.1 hypothetical protein BC628DRAFT_1364586 [Trametes gibbosa]